MAIAETYFGDCMTMMAKYPDGYWDLAVVDPPYGHKKRGKENCNIGSSRILKYGSTKFNASSINEGYMSELLRVSRNQILWGANYYPQLLPASQGWIFWHKHQPVFNFADGEFAYTSIDKPARYFSYPYYGNINTDSDGRIHPTQKPIALYHFLLQNYAQPGDKILDTHMGSQSSRIAAYNLGLDFWGAEKDSDYFKAGEERFKNHIAQGNLFRPDEVHPDPQKALFG